jgi:hypothetical protein
MRCPHCAGEILDGSRFCGICGRAIEYDEVGGVVVPEEDAAPVRPMGDRTGRSMSLFELPPTPAARLGRVIAVVALDLVLVGAGIAMIVSYLNARGRADASPRAPESAGPSAEIEILDPQPVPPQGRPAAPPQRPGGAPPTGPVRPGAPPAAGGGTAPPPPAGPGGTGIEVPTIDRGGSGLAADAGPTPAPPPPDPGGPSDPSQGAGRPPRWPRRTPAPRPRCPPGPAPPPGRWTTPAWSR